MERVLSIGTDLKKRTYAVMREERHRFDNISNENQVEFVVKVEHVRTIDEDANRFRLTRDNYKQSNSKGMFQWAGDLNVLQEKMIVDIDNEGRLFNIVNHNEIKKKWNEIKPIIRKKHKKEAHYMKMINGITNTLNDKEKYVNLLKFSYPYFMLFPHIYGKELSETHSIQGYRELNGLVATRKLPIITNERIKKSDNEKDGMEILVNGEIDQENFDQAQLSSMIRTLKNRPRVPTQLKLNYMERYLLDEEYVPTQALIMSLVNVPGTLYREEKTIVKQL